MSTLQHTQITIISIRLILSVLILSGCRGYEPPNTRDSEIKTSNTFPNIILILADDLGWSDLGSYGSEISTPNLDALAENGLRFTQFHNTSKCFPSRATLLTGQYAQTVGMGETSDKPLINDATLGDVLKQANYRTLMIGKHHGVDNPYDLGFDHYWGLRDGASNHFNPGYPRGEEPKPAQKRMRTWCFDSKCLKPFTPDDRNFYTTDSFTDWSLELLKRYENEPNPFFLYLSYTAPHDPLHAWPDDVAKYSNTYRVGYDQIAKARYQRLKDSGLIDGTYKRSPPLYRNWDSLSEAQKQDQSRRMAIYAAMVDRLDQNIGRLTDYLRSTDQLENTLILFASDNGSSAEIVEIGEGELGEIDRWASLEKDWANVGNMPFRMFKNYSHQGGINTPLIVHWPRGIKNPNRIVEFPGHFIDFMATFVDLTGVKYPTHWRDEAIPPMEGQSLLPVFNNDTLIDREKPLFWQWSKGKAVRDGRWKLVVWDSPKTSNKGKYELYDMKTDKTETNDLAKQNPEVVERLSTLHDNWYKRVTAAIQNKNEK